MTNMPVKYGFRSTIEKVDGRVGPYGPPGPDAAVLARAEHLIGEGSSSLQG